MCIVCELWFSVERKSFRQKIVSCGLNIASLQSHMKLSSEPIKPGCQFMWPALSAKNGRGVCDVASY